MSDNLSQIENFYLNSSLYEAYPILEEDKELIFNLIFTNKTLDCYCVECKSNSIFTAIDNLPEIEHGNGNIFFNKVRSYSDWNFSIINSSEVFEKEFSCSRNFSHTLNYFLKIKNASIQKIGQYPATAEIAEQEIKKFKKILGDIYYPEYSKAIGLFAHGVGVGSFVYLRRIIENFIIKPAYEIAKGKSNWDEEKYKKARVKEKIDLLKSELPKFLVDNPNLYSIVSKGIHELNEEECKKYFPVLKTCLNFVLTDLEAKREVEISRQELQKTLGKISGEIN